MSLSPSMMKFSAVAIRLRFGYWRIHAVLRGLLVRDTWRRIGHIDVLILCHDVDRALTIDGKAYSQLLDPVREELIEAGHAVGVVAHRFSVLTGDKAHGSPHSCNRANLVSTGANRLSRVLPWMRITDGVSERAIRFWEKVLRLTEAKAVLLIGAPPELCVAASRLGVPVVELMHGFRFGTLPLGYGERKAESLPSHLLALDDFTLDTLKQLRDRNVEMSMVEHPSSRLFEARKVKDSANKEFSKLASSFKNKPIVVLVALQWAYCSDEEFGGQFANGLFPETLIDCIKNTQDEVFWILRLHPVQVRMTRYERQVTIVQELETFKNVAGFQTAHGPLFDLIEMADIVLTPASGTASEAISLNTFVAFYDLDSLAVETLRTSYSKEFENGEACFWDWSVEGFRGILERLSLPPTRTQISEANVLCRCSEIVSHLVMNGLDQTPQ